MTDDRTEMAEARTAGLRARHETRLKRIAKTIEGQYDDRFAVEPGRGSVYLQIAVEDAKLTGSLSPDAACELARLLLAAASESRTS